MPMIYEYFLHISLVLLSKMFFIWPTDEFKYIKIYTWNYHLELDFM